MKRSLNVERLFVNTSLIQFKTSPQTQVAARNPKPGLGRLISLTILWQDPAKLAIFLFDFCLEDFFELALAKGVVFLVLLQIFSFPTTETRDDFLDALPVSKVLGALDQCNAAQEGLAVDGKAEVHLFELHDEVSYDLHEGEEKMLLLLEAVPWAAERASRQAELGNVVVVHERAPHHLDMLSQQVGVRIELELLQAF